MPRTGTAAAPLKWHGGKTYLARSIIALMPTHIHYVEPYAGGLAVLLAKAPEGVSEVVNDISEELTNFWRVLQQPATFERFKRLCEATPFSEVEYQAASEQRYNPTDAPVLSAHQFFVRCRLSLAGRMNSFTGITKTRTRRGMNNEVSAWLSSIEGLPAVHERLKRVLILNRTALEVIRGQDGPDVLHYCDPPYLKSTRASPDVYAHEMTMKHHAQLLDALRRVRGRFMLSGYNSELYGKAAARYGWNRHDLKQPNHAAGGNSKRIMTECLWCNF
jgi:DNA adenine methylase